MEIDSVYHINQQKFESILSSSNEIKVSPLFSLKLKPQIVKQIIQLNKKHEVPFDRTQLDSENDFSSKMSIEFVSETEAILWIGNSIQYKLNITPLNGNNTSSGTCNTQALSDIASNSENQHEVYTSTANTDTNKRCQELHYVGNVSHHMVPILQSSNITTTLTASGSSLRDSINERHGVVIPSEPIVTTKVSSSLSSSSSSSTIPRPPSIVSTQTKKKVIPSTKFVNTTASAVSVTPSPPSTSSFNSKTLLMHHLDWNVSDSDIRRFFSTLMIDYIYATKSSCSISSTASNNASTNTALSTADDSTIDTAVVHYVDFYVTFQSSSAAEIAYLRNGEMIKFMTTTTTTAKRNVNNVAPLSSLLSSSNKRMKTNKTTNTPSSSKTTNIIINRSSEVKLEKVKSVYEVMWAQCIGVDWCERLNDKFSSTCTPSVDSIEDNSTKNRKDTDNDNHQTSMNTCQDRYLFIHTLFSNRTTTSSTTSDATTSSSSLFPTLAQFIDNTPKQLISLYTVNPLYKSIFNSIDSGTNSSDSSSSGNKKANTKNRSSSSSLLSSSVLEGHIYEYNKMGISSGINPHFRPFFKDYFQYVGSNWLDENILFGLQSSYYYPFMLDDDNGTCDRTRNIIGGHNPRISGGGSNNQNNSSKDSTDITRAALRDSLTTAVSLLDHIKRNIIAYYTTHTIDTAVATATTTLSSDVKDINDKKHVMTLKRKRPAVETTNTSRNNSDGNNGDEEDDDDKDNDTSSVSTAINTITTTTNNNNNEFNLKADMLIYDHLTRLISMLYLLYKHQ